MAVKWYDGTGLILSLHIFIISFIALVFFNCINYSSLLIFITLNLRNIKFIAPAVFPQHLTLIFIYIICLLPPTGKQATSGKGFWLQLELCYITDTQILKKVMFWVLLLTVTLDIHFNLISPKTWYFRNYQECAGIKWQVWIQGVNNICYLLDTYNWLTFYQCFILSQINLIRQIYNHHFTDEKPTQKS